MKNDKNHSFVVHDSIGRQVRVRIKVNPRSRRLILRVDERKREALLVIPRASSRADGIRFASERTDWFTARLDGMEPPRPFVPGAVIPVRGRDTLLVRPESGRLARLVEMDGGVVLNCPGAPETFPDRVKRFLKAEAKRDLAAAVELHCARLGVAARRITLKDTRSRWGSCTSDGRLAFSWRLIFAPPAVLDYVAAHECAHLIEMNHSPDFWALVHTTFGDHRRARAWLKREGQTLHALGAAPDMAAATSSSAALSDF